MKKFFCALFAVFFTVSFSAAAGQETPQSIYEKLIAKSYVGKYKSIIIDKEMTASNIPAEMKVRSKTYFANNKFREETSTNNADGQPVNIITIFTSQDTYMSYDSGENFFSMGVPLLDEISANIKDIDPFTAMAVLHEKTESVNGAECYVIEDDGDGLKKKFYVEKKTYHLIKSIFENDEVLVVSETSDYKKVNKYIAPFRIKLLIEQKAEQEKQVISSEIRITSIQFNPSIKENLFTPKNITSLSDIPGIGDIKEMIQSIL